MPEPLPQKGRIRKNAARNAGSGGGTRFQLESELSALQKQYRVPALAASLTHRGQIVASSAIGANLHDRFGTASVGKQFLAVLAVMLAGEGKLDLDGPLPEGFTLRELLTHRSGLGDYGDHPEYDPSRETRPAELIEMALALPRTARGEFEYSNSNYVLVGEAIERVTSRPYFEELRERIFLPLGMSDTCQSSDPLATRIDGFERRGGRLFPAEPVSASADSTADGTLLQSISDLALWHVALDEGRPLPQEVLQQMWSGPEYGMGWVVVRGGKVRHTGGWQGFSSYVQRDLRTGWSVAVLADVDPAPVDRIGRELLRAASAA